jgi:ankyrin repeat protein
MTALHYSVYFGWHKISEILLAHGATLTAINHQNHNDGLSTCTIPILSLAVLGKRLDAAKLLLKHGAKVEDLNLQHENALHGVRHCLVIAISLVLIVVS